MLIIFEKAKPKLKSIIGIEVNPISWIKWNVSAAGKEITYKKAKYIWLHSVSADICDNNLIKKKFVFFLENFDFKTSALKLQKRSNRGTIQGSIEHFSERTSYLGADLYVKKSWFSCNTYLVHSHTAPSSKQSCYGSPFPWS